MLEKRITVILNCHPGIPLWTSITWGAKFTTYYCILLCGSSLFSIELMVAMVVINYQNLEVSAIFTYLSPSFLAVTYLTMAAYFFLDWRAPKLLDPPPLEKISWLRNSFHFLVSPLVIVAYSLVELYALHELLLFGKSVCKHGASKKQGLSSGLITVDSAFMLTSQLELIRKKDRGRQDYDDQDIDQRSRSFARSRSLA